MGGISATGMHGTGELPPKNCVLACIRLFLCDLCDLCELCVFALNHSSVRSAVRLERKDAKAAKVRKGFGRFSLKAGGIALECPLRGSNRSQKWLNPMHGSRNLLPGP